MYDLATYLDVVKYSFIKSIEPLNVFRKEKNLLIVAQPQDNNNKATVLIIAVWGRDVLFILGKILQTFDEVS